ncbi:MAG: hypothetical protein RIR31_1461 [Bacteroidota bacterium]
MKKIILSGCLSFMAFLFSTAQSVNATEKFEAKVGSVMAYHVKSNGKEYNFIVTIKKFDALNEDAIVFDWKMTDPVNKSGTIIIDKDAALNSYALYNYFASGEKRLANETSVFIGFMLNLELGLSSKGDNVKIKVNGAATAEENFTLIDDNHPFTFTENGKEKTIKTLLLKNNVNGKTITIYNESTNAFIVDMSIGFDISLQSIN